MNERVAGDFGACRVQVPDGLVLLDDGFRRLLGVEFSGGPPHGLGCVAQRFLDTLVLHVVDFLRQHLLRVRKFAEAEVLLRRRSIS